MDPQDKVAPTLCARCHREIWRKCYHAATICSSCSHVVSRILIRWHTNGRVEPHSVAEMAEILGLSIANTYQRLSRLGLGKRKKQ